jgi:hypothetical protein
MFLRHKNQPFSTLKRTNVKFVQKYEPNGKISTLSSAFELQPRLSRSTRSAEIFQRIEVSLLTARRARQNRARRALQKVKHFFENRGKAKMIGYLLTF